MHSAGVPSGDAQLPVDTDKIVRSSPLLGEIRPLLRRKHYSIRTAQAYLDWAKRYLLFHGERHPKDMGEAHIVAFLNDLAVNRNAAASTPRAMSTQTGQKGTQGLTKKYGERLAYVRDKNDQATGRRDTTVEWIGSYGVRHDMWSK